MEYFKLNLNNCVYWQSDIKDDKKVHVRKPFSMSENLGIDRIFLRRISDTEYEEVLTGNIMEFDDEKCISLKGADIPLSNITPVNYFEISLAHMKIKHNEKLKSKYLEILEDLFIFNNRCQEEHETLLSLKNKKII